MLIETTDDTTNFVIKSPTQLPLISDDMDVGLFIKVGVLQGQTFYTVLYVCVCVCVCVCRFVLKMVLAKVVTHNHRILVSSP